MARLTEAELEAIYLAEWAKAQGAPEIDLADPDAPEKFVQALTQNETTLPALGEDPEDPDDIGAEWLQNLMGQREIYLSPSAMDQATIDRNDYPEGTPERALLDWMGYPRPSWMKEA